MSHDIPGSAASFPANITCPDDGEPRTTASVNGPFSSLADRTAYLKARLSAVNADAAVVTFVETFAVTWTAGPYDRRIEIEGYGGGGGGGGGGSGSAASTTWHSSGGGGGGGALRTRQTINVTPGTVYEVIVGAGGAGGTGGVDSTGTLATAGSSGGDTIFKVQGGAILAVFRGARGGARGNGVDSTTLSHIVPGGSPTAQPRPNNQYRVAFDQASTTFCHGPGFGGDGTSFQGSPISRSGASDVDGANGGAGGSYGASGGGYPGGGAGGGGAAGPGGNGTDGLSGGAGDATNGLPGVSFAGIFIDDTTGAGGGGGGGGGNGSASGGDGSDAMPGRRGILKLRVIG